MRAYFLAASRESSSLLAPVHTIFPELNMSAVVRGSRILMMTAAKRLGLYSALRAWRAIFLRSSLQPKLTVDTIFLKQTRSIRVKVDSCHSEWNSCYAQLIEHTHFSVILKCHLGGQGYKINKPMHLQITNHHICCLSFPSTCFPRTQDENSVLH